MYAYSLNNPVNGCDPCGTCFHNWKSYNCEKCTAFWNGVASSIQGAWNDFTGRCADTFGAGVIQSNTYEHFSTDTMIGGTEAGYSTSGTILGDTSKPISVFATNASDWWKLTEYKAGMQFNIGDGGLSFAGGLGEGSLSFSFGNGTTIEFMSGINKLGFTISQGADFGTHTAETYYHLYIRSVPTAGIALGLACCPELLVALIPALAGA